MGAQGDLNCDGWINFQEINPFVLWLSNLVAWQAAYPGCNPKNGDINCDGLYGTGSFEHINPFVWLMGQCGSGSGCQCPGPSICPSPGIWGGPGTSCDPNEPTYGCSQCEAAILAKPHGNSEPNDPPCPATWYVDTYNSGCDKTPPGPMQTILLNPTGSPIDPNTAWRGRSGTWFTDPNDPATLKKDYDWYEFTLTASRRFKVYLYADFTATWEIWKQNDCAYGPIEGLEVPACHDAGVFTVRCYTAGTCWLRVFPTGYTSCGRYYYLGLTEAGSCSVCSFSCTGMDSDDPCDDLTHYDTNAGCDDPNAPPPHFMAFNCGGTYCGRS